MLKADDRVEVEQIVCDAIDEAGTGSIVGSVGHFTVSEKGSTSGCKFMDNNGHRNSSEVFIVRPFQYTIYALDFSNTTRNADVDIEIYVVPAGMGASPASLVYKWELRDARVCCRNGLSLQINACDKVSILAVDKGTNAKYPLLNVHYQITNNDTILPQNECESFSGNLSCNGTTTSS